VPERSVSGRSARESDPSPSFGPVKILALLGRIFADAHVLPATIVPVVTMVKVMTVMMVMTVVVAVAWINVIVAIAWVATETIVARFIIRIVSVEIIGRVFAIVVNIPPVPVRRFDNRVAACRNFGAGRRDRDWRSRGGHCPEAEGQATDGCDQPMFHFHGLLPFLSVQMHLQAQAIEQS
jgi:hypothetical protein